MRIRKIDRKIERHILIGMIVDTTYLSFVSTKLDKNDLMNSYARTVAGWCLEYFKKYNKAPGRHIQEIYEYHNRKEEIEENEVDLIEKLLQEISDEYANDAQGINVDFFPVPNLNFVSYPNLANQQIRVILLKYSLS